ncbi:MAG: excinuclease ABC subunit B [Candidatus Magasanikbacteria bacterium RIFCSPHIGHO2_01_FULL_50_8]|uniref:UvrABC system protein B n=2 Tax=Candidatus Magasanikiibacteriota TaxID=1752731 RepID=A0A1F6LN20_9BACT|nr:MAG: excinuclease ABC subunit B [Candidatus Magasanikbacteria bacterium RIFCSPHIGHO2_01_FULL_50_8]OGH68122.1 MAG: excinuclease ABC subunit B [Candidatus Magasanikbacteria bacterium RIFCSPHIGHO2_02_FULL_50_9b]
MTKKVPIDQLFKLQAPYQPAGDQPQAILALTNGVTRGDRMQTLWGATATGKTHTIARVIEQTQRPTLVIAHNKTLAAQLCNEFREFFPKSAVEYFVSYYDYYQPEAYMPGSDTYIEKEAMINQEIDRLRHAATQALLTRRDVIIVSSVSCIYGLGSPKNYLESVLHLEVGAAFDRAALLKKLIALQFTRTTVELMRGTFRLRGEILDIVPIEEGRIVRIDGSGGTIRTIELFDLVTRAVAGTSRDAWIFPAKHYLADTSKTEHALQQIQNELEKRLKFFESRGEIVEADRLKRRTRYDLTMIREIGYVNGVENYSRYFDGRAPGEPPYTLLDYFPKDFLTVIDESHVTFPQIGAMSGGDSARKTSLIDHGFRLPSSRDNRPLTGDEFLMRVGQIIFVSATPAAFERTKSAQVVEQIIRPTGLVDPEIIMRPVTARAGELGQVQDLIERVVARAARDERVMVTTLTKKMAEDLSEYLSQKKVRVKYLHSDIDTIERIQILGDFRRGVFDVLVGVNLLREGLDVPEVSLVAILDADKEGFLRSETALIQTIGRAARNAAGQVVLYADQMTDSLNRAIAETDRRRAKQQAYNEAHHITPQTIKKAVRDLIKDFGLDPSRARRKKPSAHGDQPSTAAQLDLLVESGKPIEQLLKEKEVQMRTAARELQFELAAILRDEIVALKQALKKQLNKQNKKSTLPT